MKLYQHKVAAAVCAAMMSVNVANAAQLVTSGDFSHDVVSEGSELLLTGSWTTTGSGGLVNPTVADFDNEASLGNVAVAHSGEVITQDLGVSLELGKLYELSVEIGDGKQSDFGSVMAGFRVNGNYIPLTLTANPADGQLVTATAQLYVNSIHQALVDSGANIVLELSNSSTNTSSVYFNQVSVNSSLPTGNYPIVHGGNTQIDGALRLAGAGTEPFGCDNSQSGALYFNQAQQQVMVCDGTVWSEFKGEQGDKGDTGEQGIQGIQGEKGDTGDKGDTGEQGIQGIQGVAGTTLWTDGVSEVSTTVNVGVGTANPSAKLEVVGNAIAHPPVADNHLVTKGYSDSKDTELSSQVANLQTQVTNLVTLVNQQSAELELLNNEVFPPGPQSIPLEARFNIALINHNGLTKDSYSASQTYHLDDPAAAFDGYHWYAYHDKADDRAVAQIARSIWLVLGTASEWIQVDFGKQVRIQAFNALVSNENWIVGTPKNVTVQVSDDGVNFTDYETMDIPDAMDRMVVLHEPVITRYFRLKVNSTWGANQYQIDELEIY